MMSRRIVFSGLGALGVAAALAGCAGGDDGGDGGASVESGAELASTSEVPVGGGIVLADEGVVITQPTEGEFKAFTSTCTHEGRTVTSVDGDTIQCAHHGSSYSATTGAVQGGPAPEALATVEITVKDGKILAA
ncbi:hypothetical protein GCM10025786_38010 [Nocardioides caeni]